MKGILFYCSVRLGRMLVVIVLVLAALISFQAPGGFGMRDSVGIRHRGLYGGHGGAETHVKFKKGAKPDLNYDNVKRRVPNGSDPIHNRYCGGD